MGNGEAIMSTTATSEKVHDASVQSKVCISAFIVVDLSLSGSS